MNLCNYAKVILARSTKEPETLKWWNDQPNKENKILVHVPNHSQNINVRARYENYHAFMHSYPKMHIPLQEFKSRIPRLQNYLSNAKLSSEMSGEDEGGLRREYLEILLRQMIKMADEFVMDIEENEKDIMKFENTKLRPIWNNLSKKYSILDKSYANTSAHCAVILQTNISIPLLIRNTNQKKITKTKVLWERRDEEKYRETILNELLQKDLPTLDIDKQIDIISNSLLNAQQQSIPSKITQLKGPKWKATPEVTVLLRMCKVLYNKWADLGKPIGHPLSLELKTHKKSYDNVSE
ncbi:unnamed protein product [Mytilus edulis]|uniref:Uncharacterized protein n=1 Tax=Mytilus edulis TaxID=6550 RepID=A0A8S3QS17_MYTED|nr:unnamed protein product [Mytilus edulis]